MAIRRNLLISICSILIAPWAMVGCQITTPAVESLPAPNFDGPRVEAARPPQPVAVLPLPKLTAPAPLPAKVLAPPSPRPAIATNVPRDWIPPVAPRAWRWVIIHHSATTTGGAAAFDKEHREKGWDGLAYDFVIGNGTDTADGQIEVGYRWREQKIGAHAKSSDNRFNEYGIGICLVGNFEMERPTPKQLQSLTRLVAFVMKTYHITPDRVMGHRDTGRPTECPGRYLYLDLRSVTHQAALLAGMTGLANSDQATATDEILSNVAGQ